MNLAAGYGLGRSLVGRKLSIDTKLRMDLQGGKIQNRFTLVAA